MLAHASSPGRVPRSGPSSGRQEGRWWTGGAAGRILHVYIFLQFWNLEDSVTYWKKVKK